MPEELGLYLRMRVREQLIYLAELHGCTTAEAERETDAWLAHLGLTQRANSCQEGVPPPSGRSTDGRRR